METSNLLIILFIISFLGFWMGLIIEWGLETKEPRKRNLSDTWHIIGWLIRAAFAVYVATAYTLFFGWLTVIMLWHYWDLIINLTRGHKPLQVDDATKRRGLELGVWVLKIAWLLLGIIFIFTK